ncbi:hypothetical protein GCM10025738_28510 [Microbacterium fluvii]
MVRWVNPTPGKFASSALPRVSAEMPVLSETKKAARIVGARVGCSVRIVAPLPGVGSPSFARYVGAGSASRVFGPVVAAGCRIRFRRLGR